MGEEPVIILIMEGVKHGPLLSMLLYGTTLVPLVEERFTVATYLLEPFYTDNDVFDGPWYISTRVMAITITT